MLPKQKEPAFGNREVIGLLESWLQEAKKGELNYAAILVCRLPNIGGCDFVGAPEMEPIVDEALARLKIKMEAYRRNRAMPPIDPRLGADYVCYNLANDPCSYDFFTWLVNAEMTRRREWAPAPLKVHFYRGIDGKTGLNTAKRTRMFEQVMRPSLALLGAVEDHEVRGSRHVWHQLLRDATAGYNKGEAIPRVHPSYAAMNFVHARFPQPVVTITLRETDRWEYRNSNLPAWLQFAAYLKAQGERVVFVRDTDKATQPIPKHETFPEASLNLDTRVALYEQAKCNFFVSNGPFVLSLFGTRPWLNFIALKEGDDYAPNTPEGWKDCQGIGAGEQFPWSTPQQRIVWAADTYENIVQAWESTKPILEGAIHGNHSA